MDLREPHGPKTFERRYAGLTEERKNLYFVFRRHLGYEPHEVDAMPWWQLRMFCEKLNEEFAPPDEDAGESSVSDHASDFGLTPGSLA